MPATWRRIVVPAGGELPYVAAEWRGCLVVIERGDIELESRRGVRRSFAQGDLLWLQGLRLRLLRNPNASETILAALSAPRI